jgi:hypothetical protein
VTVLRGETLASADEARGICRRLAETNPAARLPDLAMSSWNVGWICMNSDLEPIGGLAQPRRVSNLPQRRRASTGVGAIKRVTSRTHATTARAGTTPRTRLRAGDPHGRAAVVVYGAFLTGESGHEARLSRAAFSARFTGRVGESPMRYVAALRMQRARTLLCDRTRTVSAVARQTGYGSDVAFAAAFKRETGVSPSAYRRMSAP